MKSQLLIDWFVYVLVRIFICAIQSLRIETCQAISRVLALIACDVIGLRRKVIDENLRTAFPEMEAAMRRRLALGTWEHLFVMVCEIAHAPRKIHRRNWHQFVTVEQKREMVRYLLDPRPRIMVSGHFGNFEMGGYITALLGFPSYTVARTLDNPFLDRFVNRFRGANGQYILPKQGSAGEVDQLLKSGGLLVALGDQHAGPKGCWVNFFGRPASYHKAIALFPLINGAPLLIVYAIRSGAPLHFELGMVGAADPRFPSSQLGGVQPLTQWYNDSLESLIRRTPEQYWWLHRRWKGEPSRRVKSAASHAA